MKKILLFASVTLALGACTNEDVLNDAPSKLNKGITFEVQYPESMVETRGALTADRNFFWYAEQDRVNIYAQGAVLLAGNPISDMLTSAAQYKATVSGPNGQFTSVDDANMLTFTGVGSTKSADFVATYPNGTDGTVVTSKTTNTQGDVTSVIINTPANDVQEVKFNELKAPMLGISNNQYRNEDYQSVGEKAKLNLNRVYPVVKLGSVANNNKYYTDYLGKLQTITLTVGAKISTADANAGWAFEESIADEGVTTYDSKNGKITKTTPVNTITVDVEDGIWNSEDYVNVSILPVKAQIVKGTETKVAPLTFTITYDFENVKLTKTIVQDENKIADLTWSSALGENLVYNIYNLDIAKDFPYIVTKDSKLMVFSGNFGQIYTDNAKNTIAWSADPTNPAVNTINAIYSEVVLTDAEMGNIKKFTSAANIHFTEQTTIAAGTFTGLGGVITDLKLPKVTSYKDGETFSIMKNLDLGSYTFMTNAEDVATQFFNENTKGTLTNLDIHSVTSLSPVFGYERNILFTDYAVLETIKLNAAGTSISANEFKGCVKLNTVEGVVKMGTAASAFENASVNASKQPVINMDGTVIPARAFKGTAIKDIKVNGTAIVPTVVNDEAFMNNTGIKKMDLKSATTIGASAFNGATAFEGIGLNGVVTLNVTEVAENAFNGTAVLRFQLKKATKVNAGSLASTVLKQVKFRQMATSVANNFINNPGNVDLFIKDAANQNVFSGITFRTVTVDDTDWED